MTFASLVMLWKALHDKDPRIDPATLGTVKGITAFYPPMDLTKTRPKRAASNPAFVVLKKKPVSSSKLIGDIFDRAYAIHRMRTIQKREAKRKQWKKTGSKKLYMVRTGIVGSWYRSGII